MSDPAITREPPGLTTVRDHWWWRPGWRTGRHFYACHLTLDDQPQLREIVYGYQHATRQLAFLDQIPPEWLHITMQGIGFTDEISEREIAGITASLRKVLATFDPPATAFQHPTIQTEAVCLRAHPAEPLHQLRLRMHHAVLSVLGPDRFPEPEPSPEQFTPHVSTAYVNSESPADPLAAALTGVHSTAVTATFRKASLLVFHRDNRMYQWTSATPIPIGAAAAE
ncbi:MAG TPA: 2'-5' RNA ligase family protein [Streptosporangiaceae bacterium]|jgi:2'-5' RNA ligase|nr:2'-5' RNA ligase family protein [Streptosporangiaceae bacterium]